MRRVSSHVAVTLFAVVLTAVLGRVSSAPPAPAVAPAPPDLSAEEQDNVRVYQRDNRGVVNITTRGVQDDESFFPTTHEASGSGSILDKQGHVLTNYHV